MTVAKVDPPAADKLKFVVGSKTDRNSAFYLKGNREQYASVSARPGQLCSPRSVCQIRSK